MNLGEKLKLRIVSFNVNSVRVRLPQLEKVISSYQPEIIGLQETKVTDEDFPTEEINALGYHAAFYGQKTHYGVAILSKNRPDRVTLGLPNDDVSAQRRFIECKFNLNNDRQLSVINCYFPQGSDRKHPTKFPAKEKFYANVYKYLVDRYVPEDLLILMGDMNVAPIDKDIGIGEENRKRWLRDGKTSFLPEEREWLDKILNWGMTDSFRAHHPSTNDLFSWFDYRSRGFERSPKRGLRIDLILNSIALNQFSKDSGIDYEVRGMERPSDHCPIWTEFEV